MNTRIDNPSFVIGSTITNVLRKATGLDVETDLQTFRFLIELSNGVTLEFFPGDVRHSDYVPRGENDAHQLITLSAQPDIVGEEIIALATFSFGLPSTAAQERLNLPAPQSASYLYDVPRHVAFIFCSGRVAINFYMGGGVSELHVESVEGLSKHFGKPWRDYWTDEILELERLNVTAK